MPFIKESLSDVTEARPAPEAEYDLRIMKATEGESKKGHPMITVMIGFADGTDAPPFFHYLLGWDTGPTLEDEEILRRKREIRRFCSVFDLQEDFDVEDLKGETGNCFVQVEEGDDGVMRNRLKLPRIKD
jgi:hypothetical protein